MLFANEIPGNDGRSQVAGHGAHTVRTCHRVETSWKIIKVDHLQISDLFVRVTVPACRYPTADLPQSITANRRRDTDRPKSMPSE